MASYTDFLTYVLPYVPGCPDPLAEQHIREVCIDFCTYSLIIQKALDPIDTTAGEAVYDFSPPAGNDVIMVMRAWHKNSVLRQGMGDAGVIQPELYNTEFDGASDITGTPRALIHNNDNTFTLYPPPDKTETGVITITAALKPSRTSTTCDDLLLREYAFEIGQGVVARLMDIPGQPFTSPNSGAFMAKYLSARSEARVSAVRAAGRVAQRVVYRSW